LDGVPGSGGTQDREQSKAADVFLLRGRASARDRSEAHRADLVSLALLHNNVLLQLPGNHTIFSRDLDRNHFLDNYRLNGAG